jgi:hypothetical protein
MTFPIASMLRGESSKLDLHCARIAAISSWYFSVTNSSEPGLVSSWAFSSAARGAAGKANPLALDATSAAEAERHDWRRKSRL